MQSTRALLQQLLSMFPTNGALLRFLTDLPDGRRLVDSLPSERVPREELFFQAVQALESRGYLNSEALNDGLAAAMPRLPQDSTATSGTSESEERARRGTILPTVVILTALEVEYNAVWAQMSNLSKVRHRAGTIYEVGRFPAENPRCNVAIAMIGQRNANAAVQVERAIMHFNPLFVMFVGVAGGIKDVALGDVVCASRVYGAHSGKETADGFHTRPTVFSSAADLVNQARSVMLQLNRDPDRSMRVHEGPIIAGEVVVGTSSGELAQRARAVYGDALAIEMEGLGFLEGAYLNHQKAIIVRGISDLLDKKGESDAKGWQETASANAASVAYQILECEVPS